MNASELKKIKRLAEAFRCGIEKAIDDNSITSKTTRTTLYSFPRGCCEIASDLLAEYLIENGIITQLVSGVYYCDYQENIFPHTWLESIDGYIIDITADQFAQEPVFYGHLLLPCYVGEYTPFYDLFTEDRRFDGVYKGLFSYNSDCFESLLPLYNIIIQHIG